MTLRPVGSIVLISLACLLSACDTTSVAPYRPSVPNILALRTELADQSPFAVGDFTRASDVNGRPGCRGLGPVDVAPGSSVERYIQDAFQAELFEAGRLAVDPNAETITGQVEEFTLDTMGTGRWTLGVRLSSRLNPGGALVRVEYTFATSWMADSACENAAMAFGPAVSALIAKSVSDGIIDRLLSPGGSE